MGMRVNRHRYAARHGFTLVELAMVLVLVGLMTGFGLKAYQGSKETNCYEKTRVKLNTIRSAIDNYVGENGRYPRPAGRTLGVTDPQFGREVALVTDAAIETNAGDTVAFGALPFSTIGLSSDYAADCWERKFTYIVTTSLTDPVTFVDPANVGLLTVNSGTTGAAQAVLTNAAYAVVSHGEDGLGAVARNYAAANTAQGWCNGADLKSQNCNIDVTLFAATFNNGVNAPNYFDDMLTYATKARLPDDCPRDASNPLITWAPGCQADVPDLNHGGSIAVTNTEPDHTGNGTASCDNGTVTITGPCTASAPCPAPGPVSWSGSNCNSSFGGTIAHGGTADLTDDPTDGTHGGTISLVCNNGTLNRVNPVCNARCINQSVSWGGDCGYGPIAEMDHGATTTDNNNIPGFTGTANITCTNGSLSAVGLSCDPVIPPCNPMNFSWGSGCSGSTTVVLANGATQGGIANGNTLTHIGTGVGRCDGGTVVEGPGSTCRQHCINPPSKSWGSGCSAIPPSLNDGASAGITNTAASLTGTATATCDNGTVNITGGTCAPAVDCEPVGSYYAWNGTDWLDFLSPSWPISLAGYGMNQAPNVIASDQPLGNNLIRRAPGNRIDCVAPPSCTSGLVHALMETCSIGPNAGCASQCAAQGGVNSIETTFDPGVSSGSCEYSCCCNGSPPPPPPPPGASCAANTANWSGASPGCMAGHGVISHGGSVSLSDSSGSPTGSVTLSCNNGTVSQSGATCTAAAVSCNTAISWNGAASGCNHSALSIAHGETIVVLNQVSGLGGGVTVTCNNGSLSQSGATCTARCNVGTHYWNGAATGCSASVGMMQDGQSSTYGNTAGGGLSGSTTLTCNNGTITQSGTSCNPPPPPDPACAAGAACSYGGFPGACDNACSSGGCSSCTVCTSGDCSGGGCDVACQASCWMTADPATCFTVWCCSAPPTYATGPGSCSCPPPPSNCSSTAVGWQGSCTGTAPALTHGSSATVYNTAAGYAGEVVVTCNNGSVYNNPGSTCTGGSSSSSSSSSGGPVCPPFSCGSGNVVNSIIGDFGTTMCAIVECDNGCGYVIPCGGPATSDARLKTDIAQVASGKEFNIYEFSYKADPAHYRYRGVMAQEVLHIPGAVFTMPNGYYAVDYSKVGVPFERVR